MIGKLPPEALETRIFSKTGADDADVTVGPAYGEDAAAIDLGQVTLVISSDPISLAAARVGTLGVNIACNDVAASGADPRWLTVVLFLPDDDASLLETLTSQLHGTAESLGVAIVGGHTEYAPGRDRPLLSFTALGLTQRFIPSSGASPGDLVVLTKGAGIEGTAILAADFGDRLAVPDGVVERASAFFDEISIIPEATALRNYATAMHDPTEGGVIDGLLELAVASGVAIDIDVEAIPVRNETDRLCEAAGVDPLRIFGSGALLATIPETNRDEALSALSETGVAHAVVGKVRESGTGRLHVNGETIDEPGRDELYPLWE